MGNSFNVQEFTGVIENIVVRSNAAEDGMDKITSYVENLMNCIGNQENPTLYQGWNDLKQNISRVRQKYSERKEAFLSELMNYKELVLMNNDEVYQSINAANQYIESIAAKIDSL